MSAIGWGCPVVDAQTQKRAPGGALVTVVLERGYFSRRLMPMALSTYFS